MTTKAAPTSPAEPARISPPTPAGDREARRLRLAPPRVSQPHPIHGADGDARILAPEFAAHVRRIGRVSVWIGGAASLTLIGVVGLFQFVILPRPLWYLGPIMQVAPYAVFAAVGLLAVCNVRRIFRRWQIAEARATLRALKQEERGLSSSLAERVLRRLPEEGYEAVPAGMADGSGSEVSSAR